MKKGLKSYDVTVKVVVETSINITAASFEEALQKSRELGVKDVVEFETDFCDGSVAVIGVYNHLEPNHR